MRLFLVMYLFVFGSLAFAAPKMDAPMQVIDTITLTSKVKPDIMSSGMSVSFRSADALPVTNAMERISAVVKAHSDVCSFSGYQISPAYKYVSGNAERDGYNGILDFSCSFKQIAPYDKVVSEVFAISASEDGYTVTSRPVKWEVSQAKASAKSSELKSSAIKQIYALSKSYASTIRTVCKVKEISFDYDDNPPVIRESSVRKSAAMTEPDKTDYIVSLTAKFKLACR